MLDEIVNKDADVIARIRTHPRRGGHRAAHRMGGEVRARRRRKEVVRIENKLGAARICASDEIFVASGRRANTETSASKTRA